MRLHFFLPAIPFPGAEKGRRETADSRGQTSPVYHSDTAKQDCLLCGDGDGTLFPLYWGRDNIGIVSLNTFEVSLIEINRYDDWGRPIEKPSRSTSVQMSSHGEDCFSLHCYVDPDRGLGGGTISFQGDETLDVQKAAQFLCTDCLNATLENVAMDECLGVAVVYFKTRELCPLEERVTGFLREDFYFLCDLREPRDEVARMEMDSVFFIVRNAMSDGQKPRRKACSPEAKVRWPGLGVAPTSVLEYPKRIFQNIAGLCYKNIPITNFILPYRLASAPM